MFLANYPHLTPFLAAASSPHDFYVLGLSEKRPRLLEYRDGSCEDIAWPSGVPQGVNAGPHADKPGHHNQHASGTSTAGMKTVSFGSPAERQTPMQHQEQFFAELDRSLAGTLNGKLLLLAGVHEEIQAYRRVARYQHLLEGAIDGNIEFLGLAEIAQRCARASAEHAQLQAARVYQSFREKTDRSRALDSVDDLILTAAEGHIHQLCLRENTQLVSDLPPSLNPAGLDREDVVNAIAVETVRHRGEVHVLPQQALSGTQPVAAILRY